MDFQMETSKLSKDHNAVKKKGGAGSVSSEIQENFPGKEG